MGYVLSWFYNHSKSSSYSFFSEFSSICHFFWCVWVHFVDFYICKAKVSSFEKKRRNWSFGWKPAPHTKIPLSNTLAPQAQKFNNISRRSMNMVRVGMTKFFKFIVWNHLKKRVFLFLKVTFGGRRTQRNAQRARRKMRKRDSSTSIILSI